MACFGLFQVLECFVCSASKNIFFLVFGVVKQPQSAVHTLTRHGGLVVSLWSLLCGFGLTRPFNFQKFVI